MKQIVINKKHTIEFWIDTHGITVIFSFHIHGDESEKSYVINIEILFFHIRFMYNNWTLWLGNKGLTND